MALPAEIQQLSQAAKWEVWEALWDDLRATQTHIPSPEWHERELALTHQRYQSGMEKSLSVEEAKQELLRRAHEGSSS